MPPCALCLDAFVTLQRTTFRSSQAFNRRSFVAKERDSPKSTAVAWTLTTFCMVSFISHRNGVHGIGHGVLKSTSALHALSLRVSTRPLDMSLPQASWVRLNRLRSGIGPFRSSMYKYSLAPFSSCECGATKQTANHIISQCPTHWVPQGMLGLTVLDNETRCWLDSLLNSI